MGKSKKQNIDINGKPLQAVTIGEIKESKFGWIGTIFLFALFIAIVYFLPTLQKIYLQYFGKETPTVQTPTPSTNDNTPEPNKEEEETPATATRYTFAAPQDVKINEINYSSIKYLDGVLSLNITNTSENTINIKDDYIFIELYDENNVFINRIWINDTLVKSVSKTITYQIDSTPYYYQIRNIKEKNYDYFILAVDENDYTKLTCTNEYETIEYIFSEDKLFKINHTVIYSNAVDNYVTAFNKYKAISQKYKDSKGISTIISTTDTNFTFNLTADYMNGNLDFDEIMYYAKDTSPRKVNFELEASFYTCK